MEAAPEWIAVSSLTGQGISVLPVNERSPLSRGGGEAFLNARRSGEGAPPPSALSETSLPLGAGSLVRLARRDLSARSWSCRHLRYVAEFRSTDFSEPHRAACTASAPPTQHTEAAGEAKGGATRQMGAACGTVCATAQQQPAPTAVDATQQQSASSGSCFRFRPAAARKTGLPAEEEDAPVSPAGSTGPGSRSGRNCL